MTNHHRHALAALTILTAATVVACSTPAQATNQPDPSTTTSTQRAHSATTPPRPATPPAARPTAGPPTDPRVSWIGDALTLQARRLAAPTAPGRDLTWFTGPELDAHRAAAMITAPTDRDKLGGLVVVALGTFTPLNSVAMDELLRAIGPDRHLILVTPGVRDHTFAWADTAAQIYRSVAASRANTTVVEWQTVVDRDPALLADNGVTLAENATAAKTWTDLVNRQIDAAYLPPAPVQAAPAGEPTP